MSAPVLYKQPTSDVWWVRFSHKGTRYRQTTGKTDKAEANVEAYRIFQEKTKIIKTGLDVLKDDPVLVFEQHIEALEKIGRAGGTTTNYSRYVKRYLEYFHHKPLGSITREDVERWRDWLLEQPIDRFKTEKRGDDTVTVPVFSGKCISKKLVTEHMSWLGGVYKHFRLESPVSGVSRPKISRAEHVAKIEYFTPDEMRTILNKCPDELKNSLTFIAYTGCRIGGLMSIKNSPECISEITKAVWVVEKGSKPRLLVLDGYALPAWDAVQSEIKRCNVLPGQYVFSQYDRWVDKRLRKLCKECGISIRSPHKLRHTFATHALMLWGWEIGVLAKWLGHEDISTTYKHYGHLIRKSPPKIEY